MPSPEGFAGAPVTRGVFLLTIAASLAALASRSSSLWGPLTLDSLRDFQLWRLITPFVSPFVFTSIGELVVGKRAGSRPSSRPSLPTT